MNPKKQPAPVVEEPSLLDFLKSRLKFWQRGGKIEIPAAPEPPKRGAVQVGKIPLAAPRVVVKKPVARRRAVAAEQGISPRLWPWRSLLALALALIAQRTFEPSPNRTAVPGIVLYVLSAGFLFWAALRKEWLPTAYPETGQGVEPLRIRRLAFFVACGFAVLSFFEFSNNMFTKVNIALWMITIYLFVWSFWLPSSVRKSPEFATEDSRRKAWRASLGQWGSLILYFLNIIFGLFDSKPFTFIFWIIALGLLVITPWLIEAGSDSVINRLKGWFSRGEWQITITRWTLLLLAVSALVVFYRGYRLNGVPAEPFSDHAEKILDVYDVTQGQTHIFFPRNTGREAFQMYLTVAVAWLFGTGLSFISLKIGTVLCGLATLPFLYLLGREFGGKRVGLLAVFFAGIAYWPNVISRAGLRFTLYPLFVTPVLYYLIHGLRTRNRNDFILSGLFLGLGLHGYSPFRIVPLVVVIAVGLYLLHGQSKGSRRNTVIWLILLALMAFVVFLPLARYWSENSQTFSFRAFSRLGTEDTPLPGPWWKLLLTNTWNALRMFNWDDGEIWVHSVTHRPALDVVSAVLFLIGCLLVLIRYLRQRHWLDLFLLFSVPLLQLPSILSLAFPGENPALNRAAGALVPTFLLVALALDGLLRGIRSGMGRRLGAVTAWVVTLALAGWSAFQNFDLVFNQYNQQYRSGAWNSSEMGAVIKQFGQTYGSTDNAWIVPFPYWVDTRLPGVWAGIPNRDFALWSENFNATLQVQGAKLIIIKPEDSADTEALQRLYPQGVLSTFHSATKLEGKDFLIFFVPPEQ